VAAIARFVAEARAAGAGDVRAVATSAVRESSNREEFIAAVRAETGVAIEVLDELEEARLIHLGVTRNFPLGAQTACIFDIGGGSTEFIVGDAERAFVLESVRLGSLRLYDEFARNAGDGAGYEAMERQIRRRLAPVALRLEHERFDLVIGTSGTIMGLATLDAAARGLAAGRAHGYVLTRDRLRALQRTLVRLSPAERRKLPGMNPRRADIIVAGGALALAVLELLDRDQLIVSERALREGVVVDYLERNTALARRLGDEATRRFDAIHELARRFGERDVHEAHVADLALQLFDGLAATHRFEPADRDLLFAAALLHDIGRAIAASSHHKHGAYIVRNAQLAGWRAEEIELLAALVRYHRKSLPKATHPEWANASPAARERIEKLGGILRVADGLDRRGLGIVLAVKVAVAPGRTLVSAQALQEAGPELDGARFKAELFERAFATALAVEQAPIPYAEAFGESEATSDEIDASSAFG
ncbi:MAG: HD domain-containing protein, partial [Vulcanimicrobiaceae bacterium]